MNMPKIIKDYIKNNPGINMIPSGLILICKVLIINSVEDQKCKTFDPENSFIDSFYKNPIDPKDYPVIFFLFL